MRAGWMGSDSDERSAASVARRASSSSRILAIHGSWSARGPAYEARAEARAPSSASGSAPRPDTTSGTSAVAWLKITSMPMSTNDGPRWGVMDAAAAAATQAATSAVDPAVAAYLVRGVSTGTWSNSWSDPWPHLLAAARPPSTTRGEPGDWAEATGEIAFVPP